MTENEEKFLQLIRDKADTLDKRAEKFEAHLHTIESELQDIKKSLTYVKHKIGEHDEKLFHLTHHQKELKPSDVKDIKHKLDFLTEKTAKTEREIFLLRRNSEH